MLRTYVQRHAKPIIVFISVLSAVGLLYYGPGKADRMDPQGEVAKIYDRPITRQDLEKAQDRTALAYSIQASRPFNRSDFGGSEQVQHLLIEMALVRKADLLGLKATDEEVAGMLKSLPPFQKNGQFDQGEFTKFLQDELSKRHLTEQDLLDMISEQIRLARLQQLVSATALVPSQFLEETLRLRGEKISALAAEYDAKSFAKAPEPTPEQLQSFYQAQQEKFRIPRQVKVAYVEFPIRDEAVTPPSDAQVQDFYEHHPEQFFDAQGRPQPIEKMKPLIQKAIVQQQSVDKTGKAATDFSLKFATDAGERPDFRKAAADAHLTLKETDFLGPESKPAGIDSPERFLDEVSKLSKDNPVTLPIVGPNAIYVASLLDSKESRIPVLDEIKAKIVSIWKENWSITQAREAGQKAREAFRQKLAEGQSPEQAAKAAGITWKNLPDLSFQQARADFNDPSRVYLQACGRLPAGAVSDFEPLPTGGFFLYVKQRKLENSAELMQQRPMFAATLAHSLQGIDWEEFQRATAEEAGLKFDPRALR